MDSGIFVDEHTRQVVLLDKFTQEAGHLGPLFVHVNSLPLYLSTSIAFSIFSYKLKNYPREIIWRTKSPEIFELLESANIQVDEQYLHQKEVAPTQSLDHEISKPMQLNAPYAATEEKKEQDLHVDIEQGFDFNSVFTPDSDYETSETDSPQAIANFDSWIKKIEATREALNKMKETSSDRIRVGDDGYSTTPEAVVTKKPKVFVYLSSLFAGAVIVMLGLILFPSTVYTLNVSAQVEEEELSLTIPKDAFNKQKITLNEEASKQTTEVGNQDTTRFVGLAAIYNEDGEELILEEGQYFFVNGEAKYTLVKNDTLPKKIIVPPQNKELLIVEIQALENGAEYKLADETRLDIVTLLGQSVCGSCYAKTRGSQDIDAITEPSGTVTIADRDVLRSTVDSLIASKRVERYFELATNATLSDPSWYQNTDSNFVFDKEAGQAAKELKLQVEVQSDLFYLPRAEIENILKSENPEINTVQEIDLLETEGSFAESDELKVRMRYRFTKRTNFDKQKIKDTLKSKDYETAISEIKTQYPSIVTIKKDDTGIDIPFVKARMNINFIENNQK
jgi:hypothetical protein